MAHFARRTDDHFDVIDGMLVREATLDDGRRYEHRCTREVYEAVAHAVDAHGMAGQGVTCDSLARALDLPYTQVRSS